MMWRKFRQAICWKAGGKRRGLHCLRAIILLTELCSDCIHNPWRKESNNTNEKLCWDKPCGHGKQICCCICDEYDICEAPCDDELCEEFKRTGKEFEQ